MDGQSGVPLETVQTSVTTGDVPVTMGMEERLSAQEAQMAEVLRLLREQTVTLTALTSAREPMTVTIPRGNAVDRWYPAHQDTGIVGEATTETATTVVAPLETSTLTPPPTTMDQVIATPTTETPSTFVLSPERSY
ncbi:hypothetical protein Syun_004780 [Stephania yunnanensis]|uniref:Uncharacterized protein n=1 Tax=Stephania yunnanensis TaxID=152371 RepID=A0AAP0L536_9MAGN